MKFPLCLLTLLLACGPASGQHAHPATSNPRPATLLAGLGRHSFPVSTASAEAQKFFDQGVILVYGFNHAEAARSFRRAAELDPQMAMAHWGLALALSPNYNQSSISPEQMKEGLEAVRKGLSLAARAPEQERVPEALAKRFSARAARTSVRSPRSLTAKQCGLRAALPGRPGSGTLYATALMILNAWKLWSRMATAEGTRESSLDARRPCCATPETIGAHHLYIHAVEASPHPEWALTSVRTPRRFDARRGHLVPCPRTST